MGFYVKARVIGIASVLLIHPSIVHAHGLAGLVITSSWLLIFIWQLYFFVRLMRLMELRDRRVLAGLAYTLVLGVAWWAVIYGCQDNLEHVLNRENQDFHIKIQPTFEERQQYQYKTFEETFGSNVALVLHPLFIFGLPIVSSLLVVWLLKRTLGERKSPKVD